MEDYRTQLENKMVLLSKLKADAIKERKRVIHISERVAELDRMINIYRKETAFTFNQLTKV
jgi:hypothetical protein